MSSAFRGVVAVLLPVLHGVRRIRWLPVCLGILCLVCRSIVAQDERCSGAPPVSVPSRPSVANGVDTTQCGVLELEYGAELLGPGQAKRQFDFSGGIRFGVTRHLDFHWFAGDFLSYTEPPEQHSGFGDNWFGLKYKFTNQGKLRPGLGVMYMAKIPTGDSEQGLSSGEVDHVVSLLLSKDVSRVHFDFNVIPQWIGNGSGADRNVGLALASSVPATRRFSVVVEPYGYTSLNSVTPASASIMTGGVLQVNSRLYLDAGFDAGVTAGTQNRVYAGITYALANAYRWFRPKLREGAN